jgi:hypothetical protein
MKRLVLGVALLGLFCMPLFAADAPKVEIFGGYQLLHETAEGGVTMHGFGAAIEGNINKSVGIVGDFGIGMKTMSELGIDVDMKDITFMAGPRIGYRADKFRVFGEYLFGVNHMRGGTSVSDVSVSSSMNGFAMAFGGGIDIAVNKKISIRPARLDYLSSHFTIDGIGGWEKQLLYSAGIVFKFGGSK